jgi:hypothetical protein
VLVDEPGYKTTVYIVELANELINDMTSSEKYCDLIQ